jgi:Sulfotransferase family
MLTNAEFSGMPPFFIVGAQRSGTTMLRLMLNQHPELFVPFESGFITVFSEKLDSYGDLSGRENARRLLADIAMYPLVKKGRLIENVDEVLAYPIATYTDLVHAIFAAKARNHGKIRWGDKTPSYVTDMEVLWNLFPGCRIIHVVRDGRDVALSNRTLNWGIHSLPRAAEDWRWKTLIGHKLGRLLGEHYFELLYEDLVLKTAPTLRSACEFLGTGYDSRMLNYPETGKAQMPEESLGWHQNSIRAPDPALVYQWKNNMSLSDRIIFDQMAGDALATFGYERETHPSTLRSRIKNVYFATMKRW